MLSGGNPFLPRATSISPTFLVSLLLVFWDRVSCILGWPWYHRIWEWARHLIFLPPPPKCWDYTRAPPFQTSHLYLLMPGLKELECLQPRLPLSRTLLLHRISRTTNSCRQTAQFWNMSVLFTSLLLSSSRACSCLESVNTEKGL